MRQTEQEKLQLRTLGSARNGSRLAAYSEPGFCVTSCLFHSRYSIHQTPPETSHLCVSRRIATLVTGMLETPLQPRTWR